MSVSELVSLIGKEVVLSTDGLKIKVKIKDARHAFGRTDVLVTPVAGSGEAWVSRDRVK